MKGLPVNGLEPNTGFFKLRIPIAVSRKIGEKHAILPISSIAVFI
jgi:hypothetical protein